jgi:hypothetical protein
MKPVENTLLMTMTLTAIRRKIAAVPRGNAGHSLSFGTEACGARRLDRDGALCVGAFTRNRAANSVLGRMDPRRGHSTDDRSSLGSFAA